MTTPKSFIPKSLLKSMLIRENELRVSDEYQKRFAEAEKSWFESWLDVADELQRQVNSAFYYILSSLPPLSTKSEHKQFYGLSPGSLSWGSHESYAGHSFWDTETWMYPSILILYPE